jgi:predicted aspartyl protease
VKISLGAVVLVLLPVVADADLFRWTAPDGTVHYTADLESIPEAWQAGAERLEHPQARPASAPEDDPAAVVLPWTAGAPVVVEVRLNGVVLSLLLDTGAERTLISPEAIARAGLPLEGGTPVVLTGVTGSAAATLLTLPHLDVAGVRLGPLPVVVHEMPGESGTESEPLDGLLGRDLLDAFMIMVDPGSRRATLVPR